MRLRRVALFGAATAVVAWALARRRRTDADRPVHHTGRAARNARVAGLGAKMGTSYAMHRARRTFASADHRAELDVEHQLRTAEQVAQTPRTPRARGSEQTNADELPIWLL